MTSPAPDQLEQAFVALPQRYAGPGGAAVVLREGEVLAQRCWGWADVERRIPFTPQTMFRICSITKQFTCALLLDQFPDPSTLNGDLRRLLPMLEGEMPGVLELCHNQSGMRDYWATAMLCGAPVEGFFGPGEAQRLIGRTRTLHFQPGTRYSYCNQNFLLLSNIIEQRTGKEFARLLRSRIFERAGMPSATLSADTATAPGGTVGYEGSPEDGFRPAINRIVWTGDAGMAANLEDMIAWERFIDATRDDPDGVYNRLTRRQAFRDGTPAFYGFGVSQAPLAGRHATSHGGGLRGWRSFRSYIPELRVSVVVLFNHMADARMAASDLAAALTGTPPEAPGTAPSGDWVGRYVEPETGLVARLEAAGDQSLKLYFSGSPERLEATTSGEYSDGMTRLYREAGVVRMSRAAENLHSSLMPRQGMPAPDIEGTFHCAELDATFTCASAGGVLYGAFSGDFGQGRMEALIPYGTDIWLMPCPRSLDYSPPGDWTLAIQRGSGAQVAGLRVGCWLGRGLDYVRI